MSKGIVWLASYPKSGNTWFRLLLSHLLNNSTSLHFIRDVNNILGSPMLANHTWMSQVLGFDCNLLTDDELEQVRPSIYKWYAQRLERTAYIKIHDAYTYLKNDTPLIPPEGCLGAIYLVRNPLDIAISLSHHTKYPVDWCIHMMANHDFSVPFKNNKAQVRQKLLSWSMHVKSWVTLTDIPVLVLRYEDLMFNPIDTFVRGLNFLNLDFTQSSLERALTATSFSSLQKYEQNHGFQEKPSTADKFFRKGIVGDWQQTLTPVQIDRIIHDHKECMLDYGYLDEHLQAKKVVTKEKVF
jgi:hypothetical protein